LPLDAINAVSIRLRIELYNVMPAPHQ